ncbi:MAG: RMD1 family protein [Candidatus Kerfeldbacteria bacterium]|nr:RMD1 family protein [Candidatus Kerfeldbacteria bacterium]
MRSIPVFAYDIATSFDLTALRPAAEAWGKLLERDPIIIEMSASKYLVVFEYGSVVFFNFTSPEIRSWLERLKVYAHRANRREFVDQFTLYIDARKPRLATTEELTVKQFMLDVVKLVAIVLSRSVGLEYYEDLIDRNLAKLEQSVEALSREGRLILKRRELMKEVGLALAIQHELAYNLELLDAPDVVWERGAAMQHLYEHLTAQFSITNRVQVLERKISIISRSSEFIIERLQERTANLLEWAIIFLFVIDLVFIFLELSK